MPNAVDMNLVGFAEARDRVFGQQLVEAFPMQDIEDGPGAAPGTDLFHRRLIERAPIVGEGRPIQLQPALGAEPTQILDDACPPVDHGSEHVEQEGMHGVWSGHDRSSGVDEWTVAWRASLSKHTKSHREGAHRSSRWLQPWGPALWDHATVVLPEQASALAAATGRSPPLPGTRAAKARAGGRPLAFKRGAGPGRDGAGNGRPKPAPSWLPPPARPGCRHRDRAAPWLKSRFPGRLDRSSGAATGSMRWA